MKTLLHILSYIGLLLILSVTQPASAKISRIATGAGAFNDPHTGEEWQFQFSVTKDTDGNVKGRGHLRTSNEFMVIEADCMNQLFAGMTISGRLRSSFESHRVQLYVEDHGHGAKSTPDLIGITFDPLPSCDESLPPILTPIARGDILIVVR